MTDKAVEIDSDGFARLQSAIEAFAELEIVRLADLVIDNLRERPAIGIFSEIAARHMWDEYCWEIQEGPFDVDFGWDGMSLGTVSSNWGSTIRCVVGEAVERLPKYAQVFISAHVLEQESDDERDQFIGSIWIEGIVNAVMDEISSRASERFLDLIGPHRSDVIGYEISMSGIVHSALSERDEMGGILANYAEEMIDPGADLTKMATEMVEMFFEAVDDETESTFVAEFFQHFRKEVSALLTERDVRPALEDARRELVKRLDG